MVLMQRKLYFPKDQGGSNIFKGGGQLFPEKSKCYITCDFPGGGGVQTPYPRSGSAHDNSVNSLPTIFFILVGKYLNVLSMSFFRKILSGISSECQTAWIQIRPDI